MPINEKQIKRFNEEELNKTFDSRRIEIKIIRADEDSEQK